MELKFSKELIDIFKTIDKYMGETPVSFDFTNRHIFGKNRNDIMISAANVKFDLTGMPIASEDVTVPVVATTIGLSNLANILAFVDESSSIVFNTKNCTVKTDGESYHIPQSIYDSSISSALNRFKANAVQVAKFSIPDAKLKRLKESFNRLANLKTEARIHFEADTANEIKIISKDGFMQSVSTPEERGAIPLPAIVTEKLKLFVSADIIVSNLQSSTGEYEILKSGSRFVLKTSVNGVDIYIGMNYN